MWSATGNSERQQMPAGDSIRAVEHFDSSFLHHLVAATDPLWVRVCAAGIPTPLAMQERLWNNVHTMCVIEDQSGSPLGIASIYDVDYRHRSCWLEVVLQHGIERADEIERQAYRSILDRAFMRCELEIAHVRYLPWSPPSVPTEVPSERVAAVPDFIQHDGDWWDLHVLELIAPSHRAERT